VVVWKLDRLSPVGLLIESPDTNSASGRMVIAVFGALAEFERELIRERITALRPLQRWAQARPA